MATRHTYDNVNEEELDLAHRYPMQLEWSAEDDAFIVSFPDAPGVRILGATREEAAETGEDAIITWLTVMIGFGRSIPPPSPYSGSETEDHLPPFSGDRVVTIRKSLDVSQEGSARLLNESEATVGAWKQVPDGAATRLLSIAESHPGAIPEETTTA